MMTFLMIDLVIFLIDDIQYYVLIFDIVIVTPPCMIVLCAAPR